MLKLVKYPSYIEFFFERINMTIKKGSLLPTAKESYLKSTWNIIRDLNKMLRAVEEKGEQISKLYKHSIGDGKIHLINYLNHSELLIIDIKAKIQIIQSLKKSFKDLPNEKDHPQYPLPYYECR